MRQITILTQARKKNKKLIFQERQNSNAREEEQSLLQWDEGGALQKIRLGFLFHLAEEFDWQKGACTMPYVQDNRGEGRRRGKRER